MVYDCIALYKIKNDLTVINFDWKRKLFLDEIEKKIMSRLPSHELLTEEAEEYYRQLEYPQNDISDGSSKHLQQVSFSVTLILNTCESHGN